MLPVGNNFVDSYWRDINSEDLFVRENAIGELVVGSMVMSAGIGLIGSGAIEVTGIMGLTGRKTVNVRPKKATLVYSF